MKRNTAWLPAALCLAVFGLAGPVGAAPVGQPPALQQDEILINFDNADIHEVLDLLLKDVLGYTYVVAPEVAGRVNLHSSEPLSSKEVRSLVNLVMELNKLRMVERDGLWVIEPVKVTELNKTPHFGDKFGLEIVSLGVIPADKVRDGISPLLTPEVQVKTAPNGRQLLFYGEVNMVREIAATATKLMEQYHPGLEFYLYRPKHLKPREIIYDIARVQEAQETFKQSLAPGAVPLTMDRQNAIMLVAPDKLSIQEMLAWIRMIDMPSKVENGGKIHVYKVKNSRAADIAQVLGQLLEVDVGTVAAPSAPTLSTTSLSGSSSSKIGNSSKSASNQRETVISGAQKKKSDDEERIAVVADEVNNSLVIRASLSEFHELLEVIEKLDVPPKQVVIQVLVADVTLNDELNYGVEYFFRTSGINFGGSGSYTGIGTLNGGFGTSSLGDEQKEFTFGLFSPSGDLSAAFQMLASKTTVNILSTPEILATDNREASIQVGQDVPTVTQTVSSSDTTLTTSNSIQYRTVGVLLGVTPHINDEGMVTLDVYQEVSNVSDKVVNGISSPVFQTRVAQTTLSVRSDDTVVIGGMIQNDMNVIHSGVPVLKDVPLLGTLFSQKENSNDKTELVILITPRVVTSPDALERISMDYRRRVQKLRDAVDHKREINEEKVKEPVPLEEGAVVVVEEN